MLGGGDSGGSTKVLLRQTHSPPGTQSLISTEHPGLGPRVEGEDPGTDSGRMVLILGGDAHVLGKAQNPGVPWGRGPAFLLDWDF